MKDSLNLIWIDLEMTGLSPNHDRIIEIATVVTDKNLNILGEGLYAVTQSQALLDGMDDWNTHQHRNIRAYRACPELANYRDRSRSENH